MMKKFLSIILALTLVILSVPAISFAEEVADSSGEEITYDPTAYNRIELVDFSDGTYGDVTENTINNVALSKKAYADGNGSLLLNCGNNFMAEMKMTIGDIVNLFGGNTADYANAVLKVRFYSEDIGNKFTVCFGTEEFSSHSINYKQSNVTVDKYGWQEHSIRFKDIFVADHAELGDVDALWNMFQVSTTGWVNNPKNIPEERNGKPYWDEGDAIYIDSVWFERVANSFKAADAPENDDVTLVLDGLRESSTATNAYSKRNYTTNLRPGGAPSYTMVYITDEYPKFEWTLTSNGEQIDITKGTYKDANVETKIAYKYFNAWVYSPRPQSGGLLFVFNGKGDAAGYIKSLDWTGWKLFSFPIEKANVTAANLSMRVTIASGGYEGGKAFKYSDGAFGTSNEVRIPGGYNDWTCAGEFGVESMWFSEEVPESANVDPGSNIAYQTSTPVPGNDDDWTVFDIATGQALNSNNSPARFEYDSDNGRMHSGSSRLAANALGYRKFDVTYTSGVITNVKQTSKGGQLNGFYHNAPTTQAAYDARRRPITEGYTHVNLWVYSPGISYDQFGNYSEYVLSFECMGTFTADEAGKGALSGNKRIGVGIPANWTGWKLVSIPLDGFSAANQALIDGGIRRIEMLSNYSKCFDNDWAALGTSNITDPAIIATIKPDCADEDETTNLSRVVDGDYDFGHTSTGVYHGDFNTFSGDVSASVEKLWFSKGAPQASFGEVTTQASNGIAVDDEKFDVNFANPVVFADGVALEAPITEMQLDYAAPLALGELYATEQLPEVMFTADGHKYEGKLKFTGRVSDYTYVNDTEAKKVSFDISERWATQYGEDITLVVAVYADDTMQNLEYTELALCKVGETATIDYSGLAQYGSKMKVMLWDMGSAYPIIDDIDL